MSYEALITTINTKLSTVTELAVVKKYHTTEFTGYPAATVEMSSNENIEMTTTENLIDYNFDIIVHQEITKAGRSEAHRILAQAVDAIIAAFNNDYTLGGAINFAHAIMGTKGEYQASNSIVLYYVFTLKCVKLVAI